MTCDGIHICKYHVTKTSRAVNLWRQSMRSSIANSKLQAWTKTTTCACFTHICGWARVAPGCFTCWNRWLFSKSSCNSQSSHTSATLNLIVSRKSLSPQLWLNKWAKEGTVFSISVCTSQNHIRFEQLRCFKASLLGTTLELIQLGNDISRGLLPFIQLRNQPIYNFFALRSNIATQLGNLLSIDIVIDRKNKDVPTPTLALVLLAQECCFCLWCGPFLGHCRCRLQSRLQFPLALGDCKLATKKWTWKKPEIKAVGISRQFFLFNSFMNFLLAAVTPEAFNWNWEFTDVSFTKGGSGVMAACFATSEPAGRAPTSVVYTYMYTKGLGKNYNCSEGMPIWQIASGRPQHR